MHEHAFVVDPSDGGVDRSLPPSSKEAPKVAWIGSRSAGSLLTRDAATYEVVTPCAVSAQSHTERLTETCDAEAGPMGSVRAIRPEHDERRVEHVAGPVV